MFITWHPRAFPRIIFSSLDSLGLFLELVLIKKKTFWALPIIAIALSLDTQVVHDGCLRTIKEQRQSKRQEGSELPQACVPSSMRSPARQGTPASGDSWKTNWMLLFRSYVKGSHTHRDACREMSTLVIRWAVAGTWSPCSKIGLA